MLSRIRAEERLDCINDQSLAMGHLAKDDQRRMIGLLERAARGGERPKPVRATPEQMANMGIGVTILPPAPAPEKSEEQGRG